jgi:hypothetical protein
MRVRESDPDFAKKFGTQFHRQSAGHARLYLKRPHTEETISITSQNRQSKKLAEYPKNLEILETEASDDDSNNSSFLSRTHTAKRSVPAQSSNKAIQSSSTKTSSKTLDEALNDPSDDSSDISSDESSDRSLDNNNQKPSLAGHELSIDTSNESKALEVSSQELREISNEDWTTATESDSDKESG